MKEKMETLKKFETLKKIVDLFIKFNVDIKSVDLESLEHFVFQSQKTDIYLNPNNTILRLRNEAGDKIDFDLTQKASEVDEEELDLKELIEMLLNQIPSEKEEEKVNRTKFNIEEIKRFCQTITNEVIAIRVYDNKVIASFKDDLKIQFNSDETITIIK